MIEPHLRPQSFVSDTSLSESVNSSRIIIFGRSFLTDVSCQSYFDTTKIDLIHNSFVPTLAPLFEAAIAEFSVYQTTDGGIESTLLKLEGKCKGRLPSSTIIIGPDIADHAELRGNHENEDNSLPW